MSDENDQPREAEMGLEPSYNCPDCDYSKTGLSTSPHTFLNHLKDDHGYSNSKAMDIFNNQ